jgi:hypothetical protein
MDRVALQILARELADDAAVIARAAELAKQRFHEVHPGHLEACGFELNRAYNVLEKAFERVTEDGGQRAESRGRRPVDIPGVRPAFFPAEERPRIRELKSFRHLFRHAYDVELRADRLIELVEIGQHIAQAFPSWCDGFVAAVRGQMTDVG